MISNSKDLPIVALSVRLYKRLLVAYPTRFQEKYGSDMVDVFRSCCLRAVRQAETKGMLRLWAITLVDLIQSVLLEHTKNEVYMKNELKPEDIRLAGSALIAGGVLILVSMAFLATRISGLWGMSFILMVFISMPLLVVGILGLRKRYGIKVGWFGRNILLVGAILGPLTSLIVLLGNFLWGWMWLLGHGVLLACLALFGLVALYTKPLPRWNIVPLVAGIWYPVMFWFSSINQNALNWELPPIGFNVAILFGVQGIVLAALGYILKSDAPEEAAVPA